MGFSACKRISLPLLVLIVALDCSAFAQVPTVVIRETDILDEGPVDSISNSAQNGVGGYAFRINTDPSTSHVWGDATGGPAAVILTEATYGTLEQTSFESFFGLSDAGEVSYSASSNDSSSGLNGLDGAWLDDSVVLNEGDPIPDLPGQFSTFNSRPGITVDGQPYWVGGYGPATSTVDRALYFGTSATILLKGGDSIGGIAELTEIGSAVDFDVRFSSLGTNYIVQTTLDAPSPTDTAMVVNGDALLVGGDVMREGTAVPVSIGGVGGEAWSFFDFLGITESGSYMVTGDTNGDSALDEFVLIDGQFAMREGDAIGDEIVSGAIEGGAYNESGDWAVVWDVDSDAGNIEVLIVNGNIVLREGDLVDWNGDGIVDTNDMGAFLTNFSGISSLTISERDPSGDLYACFTADCEIDGSDVGGGFRMRLGPPSVVLVDSFDVTQGDYFAGTAASLRDSDNVDLSARRGRLDIVSRVFVEFYGNSTVANPTSFSFTMESSVFARTQVVQSIDLFDFQTDQWEEVDVRDASRFLDATVVLEPTGDLSRFVSGDDEVHSRVRYESPVQRQIFSANIDQVNWTIE